MAYGWDLGIFGGPKAPAVAGTGSAIQAGLSISPRTGALEPGAQCVCRLTLEAGITPQLFEAEFRLHARVDEEAVAKAVTEAVEKSPKEFAAEFTDSGSVVEEVIDLSPDKRTRAMALAAMARWERMTPPGGKG